MSMLPDTLGTLFDMSRDPVLGIDGRKVIVYANPAAAALLGARMGEPAEGLIQGHILDEAAEQFIASVRIGDRRANVSVRRVDGMAVCVYSPLRDDPPSSGQARALQDMASQLMTARMAMDALTARLRPESDPALRDAADTLYKQYYLLRRSCLHLTQAAGILHDTLPFLPHVTDLGTVCRELCETVGLLAESRGVGVMFEADFALHLTMADRDLLEQMLANLLSNSLAHCKQGDVIRVELCRQGERFILSVNDPGSGISPEKLARLFNGGDAGLTDPADGAGLGLLIARGIAERHGGTMILESRPGQGTSVRVSIPYRQSESTVMNSPMPRYRSDGMNTVLTELAPLLDKKTFSRRMFD